MVKRKLNDEGVPEADRRDTLPAGASFEAFHLDPRLQQAIAQEKFAVPTPVQAKAIPLALEGRDVLARAKTGSGKTAAYVLPILQSILKRKAQSSKAKRTSALILVPTRELASQVTKAIAAFAAFCPKDVQAVDLTPQISEQAQRALLVSTPNIVVTTPSRASAHLDSSALSVEHLAHLVIDEADLVLSYEYGEDFQNIVKLLPQGVQTFLASATLTTEVDTLKGLFCRDPVVLDLQDEEKESSTVSQYVVSCAEDEKFLLVFALFKLKLVKGKCIVFVGDVDRCYRVKLYLEQFGIKSCVLNSELPVNCRIHVVEEFNKGVYDIIIATDEREIIDDMEIQPSEEVANGSAPENMGASENQQDGDSTSALLSNATLEPKSKSKDSQSNKKGRRRKDQDYGISRGIDFHAVGCVLNFDLPASARSYTHRIGRTARAGRTGIALSFSVPSEFYRKHKATTHPCTANDEANLAKIMSSQEKKGQAVQPYHFDMKKLEGFKYRVESALKSVTPGVVREARIRELRQEMLKSEKLKRHLEENPQDLRYLRHDTELRPARVQPHLKHVPDYLMPTGARGDGSTEGSGVGLLGQGSFVGMAKTDENRIRKARERNRSKGRRKGSARTKKADPLKTFNARGRK